MDNTLKELLTYTAKELEELTEKAPEIPQWELLGRIIDLQGVLNTALIKFYNAHKREY